MTSVGLTALLEKIHTPDSSKALKVLVYGLPGVGKTTFAASAPNPLIIDVERGTTSLRGHDKYGNVPIIDFKAYSQVDFIADMARKGELDKYDSIVIDSISELQARCLDAHLITEGRQYSPEWQNYNYNTNQLRALFFKLKEIEQNVVLTSALKEEKDQSTERINYRPDLPPRLNSMLVSTVDIVGYMELLKEMNPTTKETTITRKLILQSPNSKIVAKSRIGGDTIINPVFSDLQAINEKNLNKGAS